jgi:hypothetical protein
MKSLIACCKKSFGCGKRNICIHSIGNIGFSFDFNRNPPSSESSEDFSRSLHVCMKDERIQKRPIISYTVKGQLKLPFNSVKRRQVLTIAVPLSLVHHSNPLVAILGRTAA